MRLCPYCHNPLSDADVDQLKAENAKLRERADNLFNAVFAKNNELIDLLCENEKLRELVQGLWFAAQYLGMNPDGATGSGFARQMRELGIEVPDA